MSGACICFALEFLPESITTQLQQNTTITKARKVVKDSPYKRTPEAL